MEKLSFAVVYVPTKTGTYRADCPTLDIAKEGNTFEEARKMIRDVISLKIKSLRASSQPVPEYCAGPAVIFAMESLTC